MRSFAPFCAIIAVIFSCFISAAQASEENSNNLYDIMAYAYKHNPSLEAARAEYDAVQEQLLQAAAGLQPTVSATGSVEFTDTDTKGQNFFTSDGGNTSKSASIDVTQPIFTGGTTISNIQGARHTIQAQSYALSSQEQNLLYNVSVAYMDVHQARAVVDLNRNNRELLVKELDKTNLRFEVGELTRTDVAQAKAQLAEADASLITANSTLKSALANYKRLVGLDVPENIQYPALQFELPATLDEAKTLSQSNNRTVLQARSIRAAAEQGADSILGELLPQISASGSLSKVYDQSDFVEEQTQGKIGVVATIPLYQGGATQSRYREARKRETRRALEIKDAENQARQNTVRVWEDLKAARAELNARSQQLEAAQTALEGVQYEAEYGQRTTLDTLNANQEVLDAQVALTQARRDEIVAQFALAEVLGLLVPQNLGFTTIEP